MPEAKLELALRFISAHPDQAADALEQNPPPAVADFIRPIPHTQGAALLEHMLPHYAARVLERLPEHTPALLTPMNIRPIAAILRYIDTEKREAILSQLPAGKGADCRLLLSYSFDTVGAWMVPQIAMLAETTPLDTALSRLSRETGALDSDAVYIVDRRTRLRGIVSLPALLWAREQRARPAVVGDVMERHPYTAASRAPLESVRHHDGWNQGDTLPVLNREQKLVGMLRHVDLRKGLDFIHGRPTNAAAKDHAIADLYSTYSRVLFALCDVAGRMAGSGRPPES